MVAKQRAFFLSTLGACLLLGLFLQWPSYHGGFRGDDYVQWAMFRGEFPSRRSPLDLFSFAAGTREDYRRLVDFGHLPWWSHPELRLRMWRPLSSALIALDFRLWGTDARLHHVHSLLWLALLIAAACRLFFRVLPRWPAALASVMFASAPCHTLPVGWLANRSTLVATALAFCAIELQLRARDRPQLRTQLACALMSGLALLCGEYALSALVYGLCLAALPPREAGALRPSLRARALASLPITIPVCAYLLLHSLLGSDVLHSGYYISPLRAPLDFVRASLLRVPVLAADLLFGLPSYYYHAGSPWRAWLLSLAIIPPETWIRLPDWASWHVLLGYVALAGGLALAVFARHLSGARRPPDWLSLGALLSLVPCAGSLPEDRLLSAATLGTCALVASVLIDGSRVLAQRTTRVRVGWLWLLALWVPISALSRSYDDVRAVRLGSEIARAWCLDAELPSAAAQHTRVYVISTADFNTAVNLPWLRRLEVGAPLPQSYRRLSAGPMPVRIARPSERIMELRVMTSDVYGSAVPGLYRDAAAPVAAGERHELPGLTIRVLESYLGNPIRTRFEFDRSLDDPSLWFLAASKRGLRRITMPQVGEQRLVPFAQYVDVRAARAPAAE